VALNTINQTITEHKLNDIPFEDFHFWHCRVMAFLHRSDNNSRTTTITNIKNKTTNN
jgi:hypothetical protein